MSSIQLRRKIILTKNRQRTNAVETPIDMLRCDGGHSPEYKDRRKSRTIGPAIQPQPMFDNLNNQKNNVNANLFPSNENIFSQNFDSQNTEKTSQKMNSKFIFLIKPFILF